MKTRTTAFAALLTLATTAMAAEPAQLTSIDPLTLPAPTMLEPLRFAPDLKTPAEKIQPMLWEEALEKGPNAQISVVILLHEPVLAQQTLEEPQASDELRTQWVAALAHQFSTKAEQAELREISALSHFPILFGKIQARHLTRLAAISEVQSVRGSQVLYATRAEGGALIHAPALRALNGTGAGVGVAVLDSGIDRTHTELGTRVVAIGNFTPGPGDSGTDQSNHGTGVAGIIAGSVAGMAPQANLWAMQVLHGNPGAGSDQMILNGLNAAYANRNNFGGLKILNMSLGGGGPFDSNCDSSFPDFSQVFNSFRSAGIPIFVASGNTSFLNGVSWPACLSNAIAVGAVTDAPNVTDPACPGSYSLADSILCYSNSGVPLDVLAPSACSTTTKPGGVFSSCFNGTSAASPYAAGVAAQILSLRPTTTPAQLQTALMTTGRPITDANGITRNRIDALQAYQALAGTGGGPCVQNATTLCLLGNRFEIQATYTDYGNNTGSGQAVELTPDSGYFWFFDAANIEAVGKVVSFCGSNGSFGYYAGGLTDVGVVMTVRDTVANQTQTFTNTRGNKFNMISAAFNTCAQ